MPPMSFVGQVTKVGFMNKTATITIPRYIFHPKTGKRLERSTKILAHDEKNELRMNDTVRIRHCRPLSARKRFMLEEVLRSPMRDREALHARQAEEAAARAQADAETPAPTPASA